MVTQIVSKTHLIILLTFLFVVYFYHVEYSFDIFYINIFIFKFIIIHVIL